MMMLTSYQFHDYLKRMDELGIRAYFVKPIKRLELMAAIKGAMHYEQGRVVEPPESDAPLALPDASAPRPRVLLVDDSEDNREVVSAFLKNAPFDLVLAHNGREAIDRFRESAFDLVLMDMQMPEMDGFSATREIRRWERESGREPTPIVALTAYAFKQDQELCYEAGCNFHLAKPISKGKLLEVLDRYAFPTSDQRVKIAPDPSGELNIKV
jgi:CheY-like chemotaxis protein